MDAEIISVGTELVLGQVTNTNVPLLARTLSTLDIKSPHQVTVMDESLLRLTMPVSGRR